jgi:hypothetical protein
MPATSSAIAFDTAIGVTSRATRRRSRAIIGRAPTKSWMCHTSGIFVFARLTKKCDLSPLE